MPSETAAWDLIFKLTAAGVFSIEHGFSGFDDGGFPEAPLVQASNGYIYGTATFGGPLPGGPPALGHGTIFRFSSSTGLETLYTFESAGADFPPLVTVGADRNLYGVVQKIGGTLFQLTIDSVYFGNISTRMNVGVGENILIGGFIINGTQSKKVMLRGIGPSLTPLGVSGALADPILELHDAAGQLVAANDNWGTSPNKQAIIDSHIAPTNAKESAILTTLNPGAYTAIVRGANNNTGIALVEVYDLDQSVDSKLANISTRGFVQAGDNVMIGGLIVTGVDLRTLIRAVGPSLASAGVAGALADPVLELHDSNGMLIDSNDDWKSSQRVTAIQNTGIPPKDDRESALLEFLLPGNYTAIVRGKNNTTGVALIEAYQLTY